ncbi:hypothetical protein BH10ACT9_BH10ACT9_28100 [soil metagenome]
MRRTALDIPCTETLLDGTSLALRALTPADSPAVTQLAHSLSEQERYLRFFTAHPTYLDAWASGVTAPDGDNVAVGAFEASRLIGVANYIRCARAEYAEIAMVVAHHQHQRGVGTVLLRALAGTARRDGRRYFVADVLAGNHDMHRVISDLAWPTSRHIHGDVVRVEVDLDAVIATDVHD